MEAAATMKALTVTKAGHKMLVLRVALMFYLLQATLADHQSDLSWEDFEPEDISADVAPLLVRGIQIDLCPVPAAPKRSRVQCRKGRGKRMCKATCLDGFRLPEGGIEQTIVCNEDEGVYTPREAFIDCEAHCDQPCQNGGKCAGNDKCVCEAAFRGQLCQYPVSLCDGHFSAFLGTWRCSHQKNGTSCSISCPEPFYFNIESPSTHECSVEGVWTPSEVPVCIADDPELELVPGEVTRDEMEEERNAVNYGGDVDEYEIYETINADKPEQESNAVVIEAQDASSNIKRRKKCPEGLVRVKCASDCQPSCERPDLVCPPVPEEQCEEGCACPEDTVRFGEACVTRKACPCYHEGYAFNNGHYIVQDCNTCSCIDGEWACTNEVCDSECSVLVNSYYNTFDGRAYQTGAGSCAFVLMQVTRGPQIVQDRTSCPEDATKACVGDLVINLGEQAIRITSDLRVLMNHREFTQLPVTFQKKIVVSKPTREFVQVDVEDISILTNGRSQISIKASPTFFNRTVGLCGTFNHQRGDDFMGPNNDITTSPFMLAEQWTVEKEQCRFTPAGDCSSVTHYNERREICENLYRDRTLFPGCVDKVAPEVYYEQCMEALCSCTSSTSECLCPFVSYYSQLCSNKGASSDWMSSVPACSVECHHGMRYQLCTSACHASCSHRSHFGANCSTSVCVEGCACPPGNTLSSEGVCVPYESCTCYFDGREYPDGFRQTRNNQDCQCQKGFWHCEASAEERDLNTDIVEITCSLPNEVFSQCVTSCEPTCKNLQVNQAECSFAICRPGCQCADGFVRDQTTGQCIHRRECPCFHGGILYNEGESIYRECNKCKCLNSKWECDDAPCPGMCDVWGDTHVSTFDGQLLDFSGSCEYVVVRSEGDSSNAGWFQVVLRNFHCAVRSPDCQKSVVVQYEGHMLTLLRKTWIMSERAPFYPQRIGLYTKAGLPNQVTIYWDGETRLHVIAGVQWKEKLVGMCGNFNGDDSDELRVSSGGPLVHSVVEFVRGWQLQPQCQAPVARDVVCHDRHKRQWAQTQCGVLSGPDFEDCHNEIEVEPYIKRCLVDACSCSDGGDCECVCTAIAAYAHRCAQRGVLVHWRHQDLCPMQCDEECERYTPCVPDSCANTQTCQVAIEQGVQLDCAEPVCVEGCALPKCKPGFIRLNETTHECVPSSHCTSSEIIVAPPVFCHVEGEPQSFSEGQRMPSNDPCVSCFCARGETRCIGRPCAKSLVTDTPTCFEGWTDWRSDTSPPDAFGRDLEYLGYHKCPTKMIKAVECRRIHDHELWSPSTVGVTCDPVRGLECEPNDLQPCADWEMRVQCSCPEEIQPAPVPLPPVKEPENATGCSDERQWSECAVDCSETCHSFRKELMLEGHCLDKECISGCRKECPPSHVLLGYDNCVPVDHCPCVLPAGEIVPPGGTLVKDECTECQCLRNELLCHRLSKCDQQGEGTAVNYTKVLPPTTMEGCWTQWISSERTDAAGDFENLRELVNQGLVCQEPKAIQCQTKASYKSPGGIDWTATGQTLTCDINNGLSCFHTANPGDGCFDYQVKFYCPCDEISYARNEVVVTSAPYPFVVEFLCPEANGLFADPVNCDHFYHCSNNFPFHKPCGAGTLFNPTLKICDHPYNVQCGHGEVLVSAFKCPQATGFFVDPSNCQWFYQCVNNIAYHKLCPSGLSFNPQSGTCDFSSRCGGLELVTEPVVPVSELSRPTSMPLVVISTASPEPMQVLSCPEVPPETAVLSCTQPCDFGLLCDGRGNCVPPEACPCFRDGKPFPVGGQLEASTCHECTCQLGGHSMCRAVVCPLCLSGVPGVLDNTCRCVCPERQGVPTAVVECPSNALRCDNGQCLDKSRWCDGVVDCDSDEVACAEHVELEPVPLPSHEEVLGPATCELIGNHIRTFDGQEFSYDYCHNVLAKDMANGMFSIAVSRECSSAKRCEPQVIFDGGSQQVRIFPQSKVVLVNGQPYTAAQLASAEPFGGVIRVLEVGDIVELMFRGQEVKLVLTPDSVKAVVDARYSTHLMGLCGLFNYEIKDDLTNSANMIIDNVKQFGDGWALPPSPGALCVSHTCKPEVTLQAMEICEKLSLPPFAACTGMENAFKDCLAATCQCLQSEEKTAETCSCNAFAAFQTACVNKHGNQVINQMTGWRQQHSCTPKCPPDQEYQDCGPSCVVTCQNFFETGQLTCASSEAGTCIPGCFCPAGLVLDYTTNSCIEPESCADKVCVGYGDPQMKTFDGWSFSLGKAGEFNIASDRDGLFTVRGLNAPCKERMSCVVGIEVTHNGHQVKVQRNEPTEIDGQPFTEEMLPWKSANSALSVFSLQSGSRGTTTVVSLSRLGVQVHYSNQNAAFSIHVPSKKFFDKMEGLCGNCNNDPDDELKLKDGETADDIYGFICSWGRFESEQNRRECVMDFEVPRADSPQPVVEVCAQVFDNPTTFAGCHALVDYRPYVEQCSKEAASLSPTEAAFKAAICDSALEYSRRCCEHGISLQWWTNLGCNTTCPGDLIYASCVDACPQTCDEPAPDDECRRIRMDGCVCPPEHVRDGTRCVPKTDICTTPAEDCVAKPMTNSVAVFEHVDAVHGTCTNSEPVADATLCAGACHSVSVYKHELDIESACGCCVPLRWRPVPVQLTCTDGSTMLREFRQPTVCNCMPCGGLDSRSAGPRSIGFNKTSATQRAALDEVASPKSSAGTEELHTEIIRLGEDEDGDALAPTSATVLDDAPPPVGNESSVGTTSEEQTRVNEVPEDILREMDAPDASAKSESELPLLPNAQ